MSWWVSDILRGSEKLMYKFCTDTEWQCSLWILPLTLLLKWKGSMLMRKRWFLSCEEELVIRLIVYIKLQFVAAEQCYKTSCLACVWAGMDPCFFGPEAYSDFWGSSSKRIQNCKWKVRYESEYLFRMRKEFTKKYKNVKNLTSTSQKNQKNNTLFINCLTCLYSTFYPHSLSAYSFDCLFRWQQCCNSL